MFTVPYAQPAQIKFNIPINYRYQYSTTHSGLITDEMRHTIMTYDFSLSKFDSVVQSYSLNNEITLINHEFTPIGKEEILKFTMDTLNHLLNDVHVTYLYNGGKLRWSAFGELDSFSITSIPYQVFPNHHLVATINGEALKLKLYNVGYAWWQVGPDGAHIGSSWEDVRTYTSLTADTQSYSFSLDLTTTDPALGISIQKYIKEDFFTARADAFSDIFTFSFPSSNQTRELKIYDLIGREVYRIPIPQGAAYYSISKNALPSGCYIAGLSNNRAKFILSR